jgi:hypothetical protein
MRFLLGLLMLGVTGMAYSQASQQPYTVTINTPHETIKSGDEVPIHVVLKNVSDHDIGIDRVPHTSSADCDYRIEVQGINGNIVYENAENCWHSLGLGTDRNVLYLKPGETLAGDTTITKLLHTSTEEDGSIKKTKIFDFTTPGEYVVQFLRTDVYSTKKVYVPSNKITIIVLPADDTPPAKQ